MQKILVVHYHSAASIVVCELLKREGYWVEETRDGPKALHKIGREKYAAVVSDILSDGLRVLEKARAIPSPVPVILTSDEHLVTRNEAIQLGAYELIEASDLAAIQLEKVQRALDTFNGPTLGADIDSLRRIA